MGAARRGKLVPLPKEAVTIRCPRRETKEARARRPPELVGRRVSRRAPKLLWRCRSRERGVRCTPCQSIPCDRRCRTGGRLGHHRAAHQAAQPGSTKPSTTRLPVRAELHWDRRCVGVKSGRSPVWPHMRRRAALRRRDDRGCASATTRPLLARSTRAPGLASRSLPPTPRPCSQQLARVPLQQSYRKTTGPPPGIPATPQLPICSLRSGLRMLGVLRALSPALR